MLPIIATPPAGTDCVVFGSALIIAAVVLLVHLGERRAWHHGRLRRMRMDADAKKARTA